MLTHNLRKTRQSNPLTILLHLYPILLISFMLLNIACSRQLTDPGPIDDSTPGRRDYVWTVDTVKIPMTLLYRIWGSSPTDVWAVGPGGGLDQTIWHYDGVKWETDGMSRNISPRAVFGFSSTDVWICGQEGAIWHYNGCVWQQSGQYQSNGNITLLEDLWGISSNDLYAIGFTMIDNNMVSVITHYDGKVWKNCNIPTFNFEFNRFKGVQVGTEKHIAILGYDAGSLVGLFSFNGASSIQEVYEAVDEISTWAYCQSINNELYYVKGNTIYTYSNNSFQQFLHINEAEFGCQIFGRSRKDIFIRMFDGIAHYNGNDIQYLYKFNGNISILDAAIFDREIFFLAYDKTNDDNLVFHGKLKN